MHSVRIEVVENQAHREEGGGVLSGNVRIVLMDWISWINGQDGEWNVFAAPEFAARHRFRLDDPSHRVKALMAVNKR